MAKQKTREKVVSSGEQKNRKARRAEQQENRHAANILIVEKYKGRVPAHVQGMRPSKAARWILKHGKKPSNAAAWLNKNGADK